MQKETLRCAFPKKHTTLLSVLIAVALTVGLISHSMIAFATEDEEVQVQTGEAVEPQEIITDEDEEGALVSEAEIPEATESAGEESDIESDEGDETESDGNDEGDQNENEEIAMLDEITPLAAISIDASNFPDAQFRAYVSSNIDADSDGFLEDSEIDAVTSIYVSGSSISDMTGINIFYNLDTLDCMDNQISSIDVSANAKLTSLECSYNNLTTLDVSANTELFYLGCGYNTLTALDLAANTKLVSLNFAGNQLTTIDLSALTELASIYFSGNNFTALDFRANKKLVWAHHAISGELIYISAGMLQYEGCPAVASHTGNLVIDLEGYYTAHADGSKTVDLNTVLSPIMMAQITESSALFDPTTGIMTIPAGTATVKIAASYGNAYTFYANLGSLNGHTVTFVSQGQAFDQVRVDNGNAVAKPAKSCTRWVCVFRLVP